MEFQPRDTDWAWLAGFIDGEGCFHFHRYKGKGHAEHSNIVFSVGQSHMEVLQRARYIIGYGSINGPYNRGGKDHFTLRFSGVRVTKLFAKIEPYLGIVKKEQYQRVLAKHQAFQEAKHAV
jgi:hypothetical protein